MANSHCRTACTRAWVVAVLAWSVARTVVVGHCLSRYGVSPWAYGAVDLAVSYPYALATAGVVTNLLDGRRAAARRCGVWSAVTFVTPDLYLLLAGHGKPTTVYVVVVAVAVLLAGSALVSIGLQVRSGRRERAGRRMVLAVD
jgi:hypothetical protein